MGTNAADVAGRTEVQALRADGRTALLRDAKAAGGRTHPPASRPLSSICRRPLYLLLDQHSAPAREQADAGDRPARELQLPEPRRVDGSGPRTAAARAGRRADGMDVSVAAAAVLLRHGTGALPASAGAADYGARRVSLPLDRTTQTNLRMRDLTR